MKSKILIDIRKRKDCQPTRINLFSFKKKHSLFFLKNRWLFIFLSFFILFSFNPVKAPFNFSSQLLLTNVSEANQSNIEEKRKALEKELAKYEKQIEKYEALLREYRKKKKTLSSEIKRLNAKISKLNLQIKIVNLNLKKIDQQISRVKKEIQTTETKLNFQKQALTQALQLLYEKNNRSLLEVLLANPKLSDFFNDLNSLLTIQDKIKTTIDRIIDLRDKLIDKKELLSLEKADAKALKDYQFSRKREIEKIKQQKRKLLKLTKGKEKNYQKLLKQTKKTAAEIRKQIFKLIGGGELSFEQAYQLAKFAEKATGVRAALILAVLDRESSLGKNIGRCHYKKAMHPKRDIPVFLAILRDLKLNPNSVRVSCPIRSDGAYGGAMGPAQFIPSTWAIYAGYRKVNGKWQYLPSKDRISKITGSTPPSPFKNADAFVATALYLKDAGAANASLTKERIAAAKYYAGKRWRRYLWTYGARVISKAQKFEEDIKILTQG